MYQINLNIFKGVAVEKVTYLSSAAIVNHQLGLRRRGIVLRKAVGFKLAPFPLLCHHILKNRKSLSFGCLSWLLHYFSMYICSFKQSLVREWMGTMEAASSRRLGL